MSKLFEDFKIEEDDELPTSVCIKCIGALEFLCDFHNWCHRTQKTLKQKVKRSNSGSDNSQFSTDESDKENVLPAKSPKRKLKTKVTPTESTKKVSEAVELPESEIPEKTPVDKESISPSLSSGKEVSDSTKKEIPVASVKEVPVDFIKTVPVDSIKEVPIDSVKEVLVSFVKATPSVKEAPVPSAKEASVPSAKKAPVPSVKKVSISSEKEVSNSFERELYISLNKTSPVLTNGSNTNNKIVSLAKEETSTSNPSSTSPNKEVLNTKTNSKTPETRLSTAKNLKQETSRSSENKITETALTAWLKGDQMSKKRKRNESPIHDKVKISRLSDSKYSKISELMTNEQKETIENYYRVDMSVVDEIKVANNMKIYSRNEIECKICNQKYNRMDKCQVHIWRHLDMTPYFCNACDFSTLTVSNIRCHIRKSHLKIKPYQCHICEKRYTSSTALEEHINSHTGVKPYHCNVCSFSSSSKQVLLYHNLTHKTQKDVVCDVCGKTFYSKGRLRTHKFIHNKDSAFKCKYCSTYFMQQEALEKHYNTVHAQDYECNICNKSYKSKKALNNHQNVHSEAKYQCPQCPNRYKSQHILKEHLLKHEGVRKYKCKICQKTFAQQSHLAAHMSVHIGIRYQCPGCKKGFNRHDNMKVHTKRCNEFLSNPDLKELLINKVKTKNVSISSANTATETTSVSSIGSINLTKTNATIVKKVIAKTEPSIASENSNDDDDDDDSYYLYADDAESQKSTKNLRSCIISDDDDDLNTGGEISVTENILSPECF